MSLLLLPSEILQLICTHPSLSLADISSLSITCKRINGLINNSWSIIANTRWVWWSSCHGSSNDEWYELCKQRRLCETNLFSIFDDIIKNGVRQYLIDEDDFSVINELIEGPASICTGDMMDCVLLEILKKPINVANLSYQYYGLSLLEYLRRQKLRQELKDLLAQPKHKQLLIQAGIIIASWINPLNGVIGENVMKEIENIAAQVAQYLLKLDSITDNSEVIQKIKEASLPAVDIFRGINFILYDKLGFQPAVDDYYHLKNSLINKVLDQRRGIPISLSAVYQSVAHSLGITLLPVNFPAHFLLKYPQNLAKGDSEVFIDAYGGGQLLNQDECLGLIPFLTIPSPDMFNPVDPYKAMIRMVANIYSRSSINFDVGRQWNEEKNQWGPLVLPSSLSLQLSLCWMSPVSDLTRQVASDAANIALDLRFNVKQVVWVLSDMLLECNMAHVLTKVQRGHFLLDRKRKALQEPTRVKSRDPSKIQYDIGLIMKHIRYDYYCVIYGWDYSCEMTEAWIHQMGVDQLPLGPNQPFYNVLVNDGTNRYAAQESLTICPVSELRPIRHWEVGKYFKSFAGDRYIPNNALQEKYPNTTAVQ